MIFTCKYANYSIKFEEISSPDVSLIFMFERLPLEFSFEIKMQNSAGWNVPKQTF